MDAGGPRAGSAGRESEVVHQVGARKSDQLQIRRRDTGIKAAMSYVADSNILLRIIQYKAQGGRKIIVKNALSIYTFVTVMIFDDKA